jgi:phage FluMu protein Com
MRTTEQQNRNKAVATPKQETSLRCGCGSLLARVVPDGVELKCRRCKRQVIVPFDTRAGVRINI